MLVDVSLARRLESAEGAAGASFVETRARAMPEVGAEWRSIAGAYAMFDGPDSPITQTFGLGLLAELDETGLDEIERFFLSRGAALNHEVSPLAGIAVHRLLADRGYRPTEFTSVMALPLDQRPAPPAGNPEIRVRAVGPDDADLFASVSTDGWREHVPAEIIRTLGRVMALRPEPPNFLAELAGTPVAAGAFFLRDGVGLLAGASTIPEYRGRGAQRALLQARLDYAAAHGCDLAMMCAEPGSASQRNAQRQGFRICYTRVKWSKP